MNRLPSRVKKKIDKRSELSMAWVRKNGRGPVDWPVLMPPIHDTRFWYHGLIGQITHCWQVIDEQWIPAQDTNMHMNVTGADAFKCKKKNILLWQVLLTCYWHMCYRIIASKQMSGIKTKKVYRLPCLGLPIFFSIPLQLGAFSQANKRLDKCGQLFNKTFFVKNVFSLVYEIKSIYFQSNKVYRWLCCGIVVGFF